MKRNYPYFKHKSWKRNWKYNKSINQAGYLIPKYNKQPIDNENQFYGGFGGKPFNPWISQDRAVEMRFGIENVVPITNRPDTGATFDSDIVVDRLVDDNIEERISKLERGQRDINKKQIILERTWKKNVKGLQQSKAFVNEVPSARFIHVKSVRPKVLRDNVNTLKELDKSTRHANWINRMNLNSRREMIRRQAENKKLLDALDEINTYRKQFIEFKKTDYEAFKSATSRVLDRIGDMNSLKGDISLFREQLKETVDRESLNEFMKSLNETTRKYVDDALKANNKELPSLMYNSIVNYLDTMFKMTDPKTIEITDGNDVETAEWVRRYNDNLRVMNDNINTLILGNAKINEIQEKITGWINNISVPNNVFLSADQINVINNLRAQYNDLTRQVNFIIENGASNVDIASLQNSMNQVQQRMQRYDKLADNLEGDNLLKYMDYITNNRFTKVLNEAVSEDQFNKVLDKLGKLQNDIKQSEVVGHNQHKRVFDIYMGMNEVFKAINFDTKGTIFDLERIPEYKQYLDDYKEVKPYLENTANVSIKAFKQIFDENFRDNYTKEVQELRREFGYLIKGFADIVKHPQLYEMRPKVVDDLVRYEHVMEEDWNDSAENFRDHMFDTLKEIASTYNKALEDIKNDIKTKYKTRTFVESVFTDNIEKMPIYKASSISDDYLGKVFDKRDEELVKVPVKSRKSIDNKLEHVKLNDNVLPIPSRWSNSPIPYINDDDVVDKKTVEEEFEVPEGITREQWKELKFTPKLWDKIMNQVNGNVNEAIILRRAELDPEYKKEQQIRNKIFREYPGFSSHFGSVLNTQSFKKFRDFMVNPLYTDSDKVDLIKKNVKNNAPFYMAMKRYMNLDRNSRGNQEFSEAMERYYPQVHVRDIGMARPMTAIERRDRMNSLISDTSSRLSSRDIVRREVNKPSVSQVIEDPLNLYAKRRHVIRKVENLDGQSFSGNSSSN